MNKKGFIPRDYVIAMILFGVFISILYLMIGSMAVDYDTPGIVDESFSEHYNKLNENTASVQSMLDASSTSGGLNILGTAEILLSSTFSIVNIIFGSLGTIRSQLANIGSDFGIPSAISTVVLSAIGAILTVFIIFGIVNAINKTNKL